MWSSFLDGNRSSNEVESARVTGGRVSRRYQIRPRREVDRRNSRQSAVDGNEAGR
jgi:hypothetical protein